MQHVKRNIVQSIRNYVIEELQNYMIKFFLESIRQQTIVQFAFYHCHWIQAKQLSNHAVVKLFVMVVFLPWRKKHVGEGK